MAAVRPVNTLTLPGSTDIHPIGLVIKLRFRTAAGSGAIRLRITGVAPLAALIHGTRLERVSTSGSFGGSEWHKTDSVRLAFRLRRIHIVRNADVGGLNRGGDEPYLMPIYITIGGNQYTELAQLTDPRTSARPLVVSPLFQHEWGTSGDWPKNNITWQEDLAPGTRRPVPEYLSYAETELRTLPGLQPNSATARESSLFFPGIIAMEEASTRNDDIRAGYNALLATASGVIHAEIQRSAARFSRPDIDEIAKRLKSIMKKAIESSVKSDLFGLLAGFDPDKQMGQDFTGHSLGALRDAALRGAPSIPVEMAFTGGADGLWQISGTISASIGPLEFSTARVSQLEVTFETGGDNKEAGSAVALTVGLRDGRSRGPFPAHAPAQKFHDGTLHITMVPLDPPAELGSLRELRINWTRQPGDGLFRQPDSWNLRSLRIVAFDVHNRRHVLRRRRTANLRFDGNGSVTILLAGG